MYTEGATDVAVSSEVSESKAESASEKVDSTTELYEAADSHKKDAASEELYTKKENQAEIELIEAEAEERVEADTVETSDAVENDVCSEKLQAEINEKSEYSEEVNEKISSVEELEIYQKANLQEENIDGRTCLVRDDIDWDQKDEFGRTNKQRVEEDDLVPYNKNGEKIELHHVGQKDDSPLAELTQKEHRGKGNDTILHDKQKDTEIDRASFDKVRVSHWKSRAK